MTPDGGSWAPRVDNALAEARARAFCCQRILGEGVGATIEELANGSA